MVLLRDHLSDLMFFRNSMSEWSLDRVHLERWGFWQGPVDEDCFEDAFFQEVLGGEGDFVRGQVEWNVVTVETQDP